MKMNAFVRLSILLIMVSGCTPWTFCQSNEDLIRQGIEAYDEKDFESAEESFRAAGGEESDYRSSYNLANSLYEQGAYEEANKEYERALSQNHEEFDPSNVYYNMGNAAFEQGQLKEALASYKQALTLNPGDMDAKRNFMKALGQLKQQQQQQQQQENQEQEPSEDDQQNQDQQNPQDQPPEEEEESESEDQQDNEEPQVEEQQKPEPPEESPDPSNMDDKTAEYYLDLIDKTDAQVQKKLKQQKGADKKISKKW